MGKIYFRTISYHAENTLRRCVDSVLNQTYRSEDIIYYICNNPYSHPDATEEMVREYAAREPRIRAFYNRENNVWLPENRISQEFIRDLADDDYFCVLDSDDEYQLTFLEKLLPFMEENRLDIGVCGSDFVDAQTGRITGQRTLRQPLLLTRPEDFTELFPIYHQFMRTQWAKVFSGRVAREMYTVLNRPKELAELCYGSDTIYTFSALRHAKRVGIFPETLHRYYVSATSGSSAYIPGRPVSDVIRFQDAIAYLSASGPVSEKNRLFISCVYANAVSDTVDALKNAALSPEEKLAELRKIAENQVTRDTFRRNMPEIRKSRFNLLAVALVCGSVLEGNSEDLRAILRTMTEEQPLLRGIGNALFPQKHPEIFLAVWQEQYEQALDQMTGLLLEGEEPDEAFLQLYLSLAASQEIVPAFLFGKVQLAKLYLRQGEKEACRSILDELTEMGVEDNDEILELRRNAT